jgi:hypothetical protein
MHCTPAGSPVQSWHVGPHPVADACCWHVPFVEQHRPAPHGPSLA